MSTVIRFPAPCDTINMNHRGHWSVRAKKARLWREAAYVEALRQVRPPRTQPPSLIVVTLPVQGRRRRDPHNLHPTLKPIVDGLVDAGLWPDDTPEYVEIAAPLLDVGGCEVVVTITGAVS